MKRLSIVLFLLVVTALGLSISYAKSALIGEKMSQVDAEKKWGAVAFSAEAFKRGDAHARSAMAADIIKRKIFVGSAVEEVEKALGKHDAYFKNDFIPAYALNEGWRTDEDTWQIVFLPDRDLKIVEVFINKNCCKR